MDPTILTALQALTAALNHLNQRIDHVDTRIDRLFEVLDAHYETEWATKTELEAVRLDVWKLRG
jgi:hypothetical protein